MKRIRSVMCVVLSVFVLAVALTGCQAQRVEKTQHQTGRSFTDKYMKSVQGITSTDYEGYWWADKILWFEFSGKDQGYRGIIYIDEAEAKRLLQDYNDWDLDSTPLPGMKDVNTAPVQSSSWYYSNKFANEIGVMLRINDLRFNGTNAIVFDVHTL